MAKPTKTVRRMPRGNDAIKEFQKEISPSGVAAANAAAKAALEKRYPGMFIPQTRTAPGVVKKKSK
jgi:hypothetical protein